MLTRRTPLKRSGNLRRSTSKRRTERAQYSRAKIEFLSRHPFDQIYIAYNRLDEVDIIANGGYWKDAFGRLQHAPTSNQIHHRNKCRHGRLNDERWWMATSSAYHERVENCKEWARSYGFLLPIQADEDGKWGAGQQALTTPELLAARARGSDQCRKP